MELYTARQKPIRKILRMYQLNYLLHLVWRSLPEDMSDVRAGNDLQGAAAHPDLERELQVLRAPDIEPGVVGSQVLEVLLYTSGSKEQNPRDVTDNSIEYTKIITDIIISKPHLLCYNLMIKKIPGAVSEFLPGVAEISSGVAKISKGVAKHIAGYLLPLSIFCILSQHY